MTDGLTISIKGPDTAEFTTRIATNLGKLPTQWLPRMWWWFVQFFGQVPTKKQFQKEGGYLGGTQWAQIDPGYRAWKVEKYGPPADWIGRRSRDMMGVFTDIHGSATGIFEVSGGGSVCTFGGEVFAQSTGSTRAGSFSLQDYAQFFDEQRAIYGDPGSWPAELEFQINKMMNMVYMLTMRGAVGSSREGTIRADGEISPTTWLDNFPRGQIDSYIDGMVRDI
ncbi:hypothetical protein HN371_29355 [Candidatus Poribacteria bacterium]|nr:hypothetical protein [Candidatus Poribacteria bacterium]MBT7096146.1 hypothetical protein [Candidatus Poribacteria bacterium]